MSHWRKRIGDRLDILLQESLRIAHDTGALKKERSGTDHRRHHGAAQERDAFPTDAKLLETAIRQLGKLARQHDMPLRQSYRPGGKEGGDDGRALRPRQTVQAHEPANQVPAHPPGPHHPRHRAQDRRRRSAGGYLRRCPRPGFANPPPEAAPAGPEDLLVARPGDRVHRQGQGAQALRVRRQGLAHHHQPALQGRPVHPARQGAARQSLRRSHPEGRDRGDASPDRPRDRAGLCRQGLPGPRRAKAPAGLPLRAKARRPRADQEGVEAAIRHRTRHRPLQNRRPPGPQLLARPPRRPDQRRHERRRLQPAPHPQVVEQALVQNHRRHDRRDHAQISAHFGLTNRGTRSLCPRIPRLQTGFGGAAGKR